ncbi:unnamed protein product [Penicillium nalgiovense]|nr:unnamed protein product [Penicillium nalgiovense]
MERPVAANPAPPFETACPKSSQVVCSGTKNEDVSVEQPLLNDSLPPSSTVTTHESTEQQQRCTFCPSCSTMTEQVASEISPPDQILFITTSCAVADEFLARYNVRGMDRGEVRRRVCPGSEERGLDCCRVLNTVVFQILGEVSNEKSS